MEHMKTALKIAGALALVALVWLAWFGIDLVYGFSRVH